MAASRPQWKGYLKLSLVSCPIAIYPAVSAAERVSFRQINRNTGNRLRQQLVDDRLARRDSARPKARGGRATRLDPSAADDRRFACSRAPGRSKPPKGK